jgi:hypothetical protein
MRDLYKLGITPNPSTAYHPQTDGQTERINQEIEQYLRIFINYPQNDWNARLPCAKFTYNNRVQTSTNASPFFINYGHHPYSGTNTRKNVKSQSATEFTNQMKKIWEETEASLVSTADQMKCFYDRKQSKSHNYQVGDQVLLDGKNIPTMHPTKKLEDCHYGPFQIINKVGESTYRIKVPRSWKMMHPVFNEIFLKPYTPSDQNTPKHPPPTIIEGQEEYDVEEIMDSKLIRRKLHYLIKWTGYPLRHEWTWEPAGNLTCLQDSVNEFHLSHPSVLCPVDLNLFHFVPIPKNLTKTNTDNQSQSGIEKVL